MSIDIILSTFYCAIVLNSHYYNAHFNNSTFGLPLHVLLNFKERKDPNLNVYTIYIYIYKN